MDPKARPSRARLRGFTVLELIVAIGIVAILVSVVLPTLGSARQSAQIASRQVVLKNLAQAIELYCGANENIFPNGDTKPWYGPADAGPDYDFGRRWEWAMIDAGIMTEHEAYDPNQYDVRNTRYSITLIHPPSVFTVGNVLPPSQREVAPIRTHLVEFPSSKGSMYLRTVDGSGDFPSMSWCCAFDHRGPVSFLDGSVEVLARSDLLTPNPAVVGDVGIWVWSTWGGTRGRDR